MIRRLGRGSVAVCDCVRPDRKERPCGLHAGTAAGRSKTRASMQPAAWRGAPPAAPFGRWSCPGPPRSPPPRPATRDKERPPPWQAQQPPNLPARSPDRPWWQQRRRHRLLRCNNQCRERFACASKSRCKTPAPGIKSVPKQVPSRAPTPAAGTHLVRSHFVNRKYGFSPGCEKCGLTAD